MGFCTWEVQQGLASVVPPWLHGCWVVPAVLNHLEEYSMTIYETLYTADSLTMLVWCKQGRKTAAQVQRLEALHAKQQAVLRRKTEEAEAARKRLHVGNPTQPALHVKPTDMSCQSSCVHIVTKPCISAV